MCLAACNPRRPIALLQHSWAEPCGFVTSFIEHSFAPLVGHSKAHLTESLRVPSRDELALAAIFLVYSVTQSDIIGMATHGLREGPLQTVWIIVALGAAHAGIAVSWTIVGHGSFGEVVPPFAGWAICEERVRIGEKRRVGKGSLKRLSVQYSIVQFVSLEENIPGCTAVCAPTSTASPSAQAIAGAEITAARTSDRGML
jgi:hypothetical protein